MDIRKVAIVAAVCVGMGAIGAIRKRSREKRFAKEKEEFEKMMKEVSAAAEDTINEIFADLDAKRAAK